MMSVAIGSIIFCIIYLLVNKHQVEKMNDGLVTLFLLLGVCLFVLYKGLV